MVQYTLWLAMLLLPLIGYAQRMEGLTHRADTSFNNASAYRQARKQYPSIVLVTDSLPPGVEQVRNVPYTTIDGHTLPLDVFYPARSAKPLPAVMIIHGGGWRSGNRQQHIPLAERLAARGFVCFTVSYRLSTDALYPAAVHDLKAAIRWIRAHAVTYHADTARVAVLGFSAGAQLAALLGSATNVPALDDSSRNTPYSSAVQAVVNIDGILAFIHPESGEGNDTKSISAATNWFGYTRTENPDLWRQASALTYAGKHSPPTLFLNSSVVRMHAGREDYIAILQRYGIYTEVHTFSETPHTFCLFEPWFTPVLNYTTAFLQKVL
ncbi:alpha/beta hydrolase [Dawidia soli]|uniref:Alpha/beta hydrolase n=1 Tax=Dawidia soli TaxID=2782352 RepID=A0AAP2GG99_9BACT|nr:alpha/beta hydrolase [Dawidia soli]MBT1685896.1 alpha/beta hydrolase [Dawidia soli]